MNKSSTCVVNDCDRDTKARGLCRTHHSYLKRGYAVEDMKPIVTYAKVEVCIAPDCEKKSSTRNLCVGHYGRFRRGEHIPNVPGRERRAVGECEFEQCGKAVYGHGLCLGHYTQKARGRELKPLTPYREQVKHLPCSFPDCENNQSAGGYCTPHYRQNHEGRELTPISEMIRPADYRNENGHKWCSACKEFKEESLFTSLKRSPDGLDYRCNPCNLAKISEYSASGRKRARRYGLTLERFNKIIEVQQGKCSICGDELKSNSPIDHDHACCPGTDSCGECVRGILCQRCNITLGYVRDDQEILAKMIEYLASPTAQNV